MIKKGMAFLLALILGFSPVVQVNANSLNGFVKDYIADDQEVIFEDSSETTVESILEEESEILLEETEETPSSEEIDSKEDETLEETEEVSSEEVSSEEVSSEEVSSEEGVTETLTEPDYFEDLSFEEETTSTDMDSGSDIISINSTMITEDIDLRNMSTDTSGPGYVWDADSKTFTMNGYNSKGTLFLPKDTTLVLTEGSNNLIDLKESLWYEYKSAVSCVGNLTITGLGKLTIDYTRGQAIVVSDGKLKFFETDVSFVNKDSSGSRAFPETAHIIASNLNIENPTRGYTYIYTKNGVVSGCDLTFGEKGIKYTFDELDNYFGVLNEETGLYQITFQRKQAYAKSENNSINEIHIGQSITLKVISNSFNGKKGKLQWYKALSYFSPQDAAVKIDGATENTLTVTGENYGVEYYYCEISAGDYQSYSETVAVAIGHEGSKICTVPLIFSTTESVDRLATDGFKWDHTTLTATFSNMDYLYPFFGSNSNRYMKIPAGSTLCFEGNNYAIDNQMRIDDNNQEGLVTKFTGTGTFHIDNIYLYLEESSQIHLTDGISLNVLQFSAGGKGGNLIIDNASLKADNDVYGNNDIILKNNSALKCGDELDVEKSLLIGEKCTVFTGGRIIIGANLDIAKDALLTTESVIKMDYNNNTDNATCVINGTLHIKERTNPEILFSIFSLEENPIVLGEGVSIISPQGAEIGNKYPDSDAYKAFLLNGSAYMNELLVGKESYTIQNIKIDKGIYGIPKYGNTLKTGEVIPADAMVSYQWQYAENKEGPWNDISKRTKNTFFVDTKYHGYYLRVVMKGIGTYTGTVISDVVGPVEGDPASLKALYGLGADASEVLISNFDGHNFSYSPITSANEDGTYRYFLIPVNENAKIKLYNDTTGFEGEGQIIDVPMAEGENIVRIEVTYGTRTVTYKLEHTIKPTVYYLTFSVYGAASNKLTASFVDSKGISQTVTTTRGQTSNRYGIARGTKVTLTSETDAGKCAYFYGEIPEMADYTKEGSPLTFEVKGSMEVSFGSDNHIGAKRLNGLNAEWLLDQERARIKVNPYAFEGLSTKYNVTVEIYDEEGTIAESIKIPNSTAVDSNGFYQVDSKTLDSSKNYTIKAFYTDLINTYGSDVMDDLQKCKFVLEKRREISLSVESEYIVLKPGETVPVKIIYNGYTGSNLSADYFDTKVVDKANTYISEDENGNKILYICALEEGSTYVTLIGDNYVSAGGSEFLYAHVRVEVNSKDEADTFYLGSKKGTLNLYDNTAITVPVYNMNCGHKIQSAEFVKESLNEKFTIHVVNDRTLKILPKVPLNDGTVDYAKWVKKKGTTGTFQSKIRINYNNAYSKDSDETFTVTLNAKAPKIMSSKISFSSFYTSQVKQLDVSVNGEVIDRIEVDKVKTTSSKVACPTWLSLTDENGTVVFDGKTFPDKKANTFLYLQVWPKGYFVPLQTKVKVSVDYIMPSLVPSKNPYIFPRNNDASTSISFNIKSGDKDVSYKDLGVNNIRLIADRDFAFLNKAESDRLKLSKTVKQKNVNVESGEISLSKKYSTPLENGIIRCYVAVKNGKEEIPVDISIKTKNSAIVLNKSKIVLDALYADEYYDDMQNVVVSTNITNSQPGADMYTYQVTMVGDKNKTDYSSHLNFIFWNSDKKEVTICRTADTVSGKTYKVKISHPNFEKPATLTVKVKKSATPKLRVDKKEITLNRILSNASGAQSLQFSISLKDKPVYWRLTKAIITSPTVKDEDISFNLKFNNSTNRLGIETTNTTKKGVYNFIIEGKMDNVQLKPVQLTVKVVDKIPSIKLAKNYYTLNKNLTENDKVVVTLPTGNYKYESANPWTVKSIKTKEGKNAFDKLDYTWNGNILTLSANDKSEYNKDYQVVCTCNFANGIKKNVTLNVKIADKNAVVSAKGKSKGVIELARPNNTSAEIIYSFKNWNEYLYQTGDNTPLLEWEIYAKNGKNAITTADGALNDEGLVAKGNSLSAVTENGSWFVNSGYRADNPYKLNFMINNKSTVLTDGVITTQYTYTVKTKITFPSLDETFSAQDVIFKVENGSTKYDISPKAVTLNKLDSRGRVLFTITDKNTDCNIVQDIAYVEVASDKNVVVSNAVEIVPLYKGKDSITYVLYWKDRNASNVKSGKVKLNIYLEGNDSKWKKPSATINLKVNIM